MNELLGILHRLHKVPLLANVVSIACLPFPGQIRALDAIHVASALDFEARIAPAEFWTHDERQANAALSRGLAVRGV